MIDIHTHIMPGIDDGARDAEMSIRMLRTEWEQGVRAVVLTPHFYRSRESLQHFISRRDKAQEILEEAIAALPAEEQKKLPERYIGAEVEWMPNMGEWEDLDQLCYGGSSYFLLEMPFCPWDARMFRSMYDLVAQSGLTPVIAHIDRYFQLQKKAEIEELLCWDLPVQFSTACFEGFRRKRPLSMMRDYEYSTVISDCHNLEDRAPDMGAAMETVRDKLGDDDAERIRRYSWTIVGKSGD